MTVNVEIRFKQTPFHKSVVVGEARVGSSLKKAFGVFGKDVSDAISEHCHVYISNPRYKTEQIKPVKWKSQVLREDDRVTVTVRPGGWIAAVVTFILSVAASYYLTPEPPEPGTSGGISLYTFGGGSNEASPYTPIPVVFGEFHTPLKFTARPSGRVVPGKARDYLSVIGTFGPGPVEAESIRIGDVPVNEAKIERWFYDGSAEFAPQKPPYYAKTFRSEPVQNAIDGSHEPDKDWAEFRTLNNPEGVRFDLSFPGGLKSRSERSGREYAGYVKFELQIKNANSDGWGKIIERIEKRWSNDPFYVTFQFDLDRTWADGADVRIRRLGIAGTKHRHYAQTNQTTLIRVESWRSDEPNLLPANYSLFTARIQSDARISNNIPVITATVKRKINDWSAYDEVSQSGQVLAYTDNPAWAYLDILFGVNGENRVKHDLIDWERFKQWALFCDEEISYAKDNGVTVTEKTARFNAVIDNQITLSRMLKTIAAAGYASPCIRGNKFSVYWETRHENLVDQPSRIPVGLLTPATTRRFVAKKGWRDEVHAYRVSYYDPENDYEVNQVLAYADGYSEANASIIKDTDARQMGCTSASAAWRIGRTQLVNALIYQETFTAEVNMESMVYEVGDVVAVLNDAIKVGGIYGRVQGGKHAPADGYVTAEFTLDQVIPNALRSDDEVKLDFVDGKYETVGEPRLRLRVDTPSGMADVYVFTRADEGSTVYAKYQLGGVLSPEFAKINDADKQVEYSLGKVGEDAMHCVIHSVSPQRGNTARLVLKEFKPDALIQAWKGDIPKHKPIVTAFEVGDARNAPPRPVFGELRAGSIKPTTVNGQEVSDIFVFFEPVQIGGRFGNISDLLLEWRLEDGDDWIGGVFNASLPAVLQNVPVGARYVARAAYRDAGGRQGEFGETTLKNNAAKVTNDAVVAPINRLEIEGQGNDTEFYGRNVAVVWNDPASVVDAETTAGEFQGLGAGSPQLSFKSYGVQLFGKSGDERKLLQTKEVLQARVEFVDLADSGYREFEVRVTRADLHLGRSAEVMLEIANPKPIITADDVDVVLGAGFYKLEFAAAFANLPDLREVAVVRDGVVVARGGGREVRVDAPDGADAGDVTVYVADVFESSVDYANDWNSVTLAVGAVQPSVAAVGPGGAIIPISTRLPPKPTGLAGVSSPSAVLLKWTDPADLAGDGGGLYDYHGRTEVWRVAGSADSGASVDDAALAGEVHLPQFVDGSVSGGVTYQYRIRFVSASEVTGVWSDVVEVVAGRDEIDGSQVLSGTIAAARIDAENIVAGSLVAKASITAPRIYGATQIHGGVDAVWTGGYIKGAVIEGATIIAGDDILYRCDPAYNSKGEPLLALESGIGAESEVSVDAVHRRNPTRLLTINHWVPDLSMESSGPSGNPYYNFRGGVILKTAYSVGPKSDGLFITNSLPLPSSSYDDHLITARYRWREVAPQVRFSMNRFIGDGEVLVGSYAVDVPSTKYPLSKYLYVYQNINELVQNGYANLIKQRVFINGSRYVDDFYAITDAYAPYFNLIYDMQCEVRFIAEGSDDFVGRFRLGALATTQEVINSVDANQSDASRAEFSIGGTNWIARTEYINAGWVSYGGYMKIAEGFTIIIEPATYNDYITFESQGYLTASLNIIELIIPTDVTQYYGIENGWSGAQWKKSNSRMFGESTIQDDPNNLIRRKPVSNEPEDTPPADDDDDL